MTGPCAGLFRLDMLGLFALSFIIDQYALTFHLFDVSISVRKCRTESPGILYIFVCSSLFFHTKNSSIFTHRLLVWTILIIHAWVTNNLILLIFLLDKRLTLRISIVLNNFEINDDQNRD